MGQKIELGNFVGPGAFEVIATARLDRDRGVFIGKAYESDLRTPQFVVSTYDLGADWWHNGRYVGNAEAALAAFVNLIDDTMTVFRP